MIILSISYQNHPTLTLFYEEKGLNIRVTRNEDSVQR